MKYLVSALAATFVLGFVSMASAAENPTGTWKWTASFGQGDKKQSREVTLNLKLDGDKLTGSMPGRDNNETPIEEGSFKGDEISFKITRSRGDNKFTSTYKGKISGDTIKGTIERPGRDGKTNTSEWEAKRAK